MTVSQGKDAGNRIHRYILAEMRLAHQSESVQAIPLLQLAALLLMFQSRSRQEKR
jgi:hypothetical protein